MSLKFAHDLITMYAKECGNIPKRIPLPKNIFTQLAIETKSMIRETSDDYTNYRLFGTPMPSQIKPDFITINSNMGRCEFYCEEKSDD